MKDLEQGLFVTLSICARMEVKRVAPSTNLINFTSNMELALAYAENKRANK